MNAWDNSYILLIRNTEIAYDQTMNATFKGGIAPVTVATGSCLKE